MATDNLIKFFQLQRQIFGVCPHSGTLFRLSDCNIYVKKKPKPDWMQKVDEEQDRIDKAKERLESKENEIKEKAREAGRKEANKVVKKLDTIFNPLRLNPDDSKVLFHPVDFIVFNGMKAGKMKNLILMDKEKKAAGDKQLQRSIDKVVEKGNYEWVTLRIEENGNIREE